MKSHVVVISRLAEKQLTGIPRRIQEALLMWARSVEEEGLSEVKKLPGYHDEPLKGRRFGQRSVRMSRSWRIIYKEEQQGHMNLLVVLEVVHHDY
jgi:proteic killer suppression protein